jgi:hypothetical protein
MRNAVNILVPVTKPKCVVETQEDSNAAMMLNPAVGGSAVTLA